MSWPVTSLEFMSGLHSDQQNKKLEVCAVGDSAILSENLIEGSNSSRPCDPCRCGRGRGWCNYIFCYKDSGYISQHFIKKSWVYGDRSYV